MRTRTDDPRYWRLASVGLLSLSALVAACGGGAAAAAPAGPAEPDVPAEVVDAVVDAASGDAADGELADEAWVAAAIDALYARDSFSFEVESTVERSEGEVTSRVYGIVRPADESSVVNFEVEGSVSQYVTIGTESWIDYGDGQYRPQDETDESGEYLRSLWDEYFAGSADDFVHAGSETVHGRPTVHLTFDPYLLEKKVEMFGEEWRGWTLELWLAEDDGHLVRAVYGGPLAPIDFSLPRFTIDVKNVDCECPVHDPS